MIAPLVRYSANLTGAAALVCLHGEVVSRDARTVLYGRIVECLKAEPGMTAKELGSVLRAPTRIVNQLLYGRTVFLNDQAKPPRWRYVEVAGSADGPAVPLVPDDASPGCDVRTAAEFAGIEQPTGGSNGAGTRKVSSRRKRRVSDAVAERNQAIMRMRLEGRTLEEIGQSVSLSRERVRQILKRSDGEIREHLRSVRESDLQALVRGLELGQSISEIAGGLGIDGAAVDRLLSEQPEDESSGVGAVRQKALVHVQQIIERFLLDNPGGTIASACAATGLSHLTLQRLTPRMLSRLTVPEESDGRSGEVTQVWSDADILRSLRVAATYEFPLTAKFYESLRSIGELVGPSIALVYVRFGSWRSACQSAGVEAGEANRNNYESRWTDDDLLRFVGRYLADESSAGTFGDFEHWLSQDRERPSGATVRKRLGGWWEIKRVVLTADWFKKMLEGGDD